MRTLTTLLLALTSSFVWAEEVYREVNDAGVPSFSDQAMPGAEPVTVRKTSTFTDTTYQQNQLKRQNADSLTPEKIDYHLLVTNPPNGSAIRDNAGNLNLTISISPSVQSGHRAELLMDGIKIRDIRGNGDIALTNVDRGTHAFTIRVIDNDGNVVTEGPSNNISILRYSLPRKTPK
ncbi:MAG: hypothetical protein O3C68_00415 [Proteobacteria bacterium]|nr:hypothetical protein [Pseudomonadota bacterium]